jgi:hypothetical protein
LWSLWLANQFRASRVWRVLTILIVPCVTTPLVLGGVLGDRAFSDVAKAALLVCSVLVAIGTLMHAARAPRLESE